MSFSFFHQSNNRASAAENGIISNQDGGVNLTSTNNQANTVTTVVSDDLSHSAGVADGSTDAAQNVLSAVVLEARGDDVSSRAPAKRL